MRGDVYPPRCTTPFYYLSVKNLRPPPPTHKMAGKPALDIFLLPDWPSRELARLGDRVEQDV